MPPKAYHSTALEVYQYVTEKDPTTLKNNPEAILNAINDYAAKIKHLMTYSDAKLSATEQKLATLNPAPKTLVELGGYVGRSAVAWGPMLKRINNSAAPSSTAEANANANANVNANTNATGDVKVYSLELEPDFCTVIQAFVDLGGLSDTVTVLQGESSVSLKKLKASGQLHSIDILFLDHWKDCYLPDLRLCEDLRLLRKGSVVVADNTDVPGAPEYLAYVEGEGEGGWKYRCESVDVGEGERRPNIVHFAYVEATP